MSSPTAALLVPAWRVTCGGGRSLLSDERGDDVRCRDDGCEGGDPGAGFLDLVNKFGDVEDSERCGECEGREEQQS